MNTIAIDFPGTIEIKPGYEEFFNGMMNIVNGSQLDANLGENIRSYVFDFLENCDLNNFNEFSDTSYKRVHLGKDNETGWEAIMMCWKKGVPSSVHGHPQFAGYNFAKGRFLIEVFKENGDKAELVDKFEAEGGQGFFAIGEKDKFNNHIHRITCLDDKGHSLHVYSDDARRGKKYI